MLKHHIVALIPMRHESERIKGKNYRLFANKPLYHYILQGVLSCPLINEVVIDSDSPLIMEDVLKNFRKVRLIERPEYLREGTVPMNDVLLFDVKQVDADFYIQTHSTNPLLSSETITRGIKLFLDNHPIYDSLFSVTRVQTRLWDNLTRPLNHNPAILMRTQDLPPIFEENSCLYIFTRNSLELHQNRIGKRPMMFEIDRLEALDINEEVDFRIAEFIYLEQQKSLERLKK